MDQRITPILQNLTAEGRLRAESQYISHGTTSLLEHSIDVAEEALHIVDRLHLRVDEEALIRGALLHDYYLYDWHDSQRAPSWHGFKHPYIALRNARKDFDLNAIEEDIIRRHMFPLTPIPPMHLEAWVVCMADKYCAAGETTAPYVRKFTSLLIK